MMYGESSKLACFGRWWFEVMLDITVKGELDNLSCECERTLEWVIEDDVYKIGDELQCR